MIMVQKIWWKAILVAIAIQMAVSALGVVGFLILTTTGLVVAERIHHRNHIERRNRAALTRKGAAGVESPAQP